MKTLIFSKNVHHQGRNLTVRRGIKWALETEAAIPDATTRSIGVSGIMRRVPVEVQLITRVVRFLDLKDDDLRHEHDENCRTVGGLLAELQRVYPGFDPRELVTLVEYTMP